MKLLLTAFDPFGGEPINPALEAVKLVSDTVGSVQVSSWKYLLFSVNPLIK